MWRLTMPSKAVRRGALTACEAPSEYWLRPQTPYSCASMSSTPHCRGLRKRVNLAGSKSRVHSQQHGSPGEARNTSATIHERPNAPFPIVGIGASAGGLEAFTALLSKVPQRREWRS